MSNIKIRCTFSQVITVATKNLGGKTPQEYVDLERKIWASGETSPEDYLDDNSYGNKIEAKFELVQDEAEVKS